MADGTPQSQDGLPSRWAGNLYLVRRDYSHGRSAEIRAYRTLTMTYRST
jgi:hypothetical protein